LRKFYILLFVLVMGLLLLARPGLSSGAAITAARLKPASVKVGDSFALEIDYSLPAGARLDRTATLKHYAGFTPTDFSDAGGRLRLSFLNDRLSAVSVPVRLSYSGAARGELKGQPLRLEVTPRKELKDIEPIRDILPAKPWLRIVLWLATLAALALLGWLAWWLYRRFSKPPYAPLEKPASRALRRLCEIERLFAVDQKHYYFEFSAIVREYLGQVRGVPAAEMTSEELKQVLTSDEDRLIVRLLTAADLIKFADAIATSERQAEELALIRAYIDATAPGNEP